MALSIDVCTLFPDWFSWMFKARPIANAIEGGELELGMIDLRSHSHLKHHQVDDTPYGGGAGMILRVDIIVAALEATYGLPLADIRERRRIVALAPAGNLFDDRMTREWSGTADGGDQLVEDAKPITILCGRFEGFDHRVHDYVATEEVSIGSFVLSGGEPAAMAMIDAVARKLPGALGNQESLTDESFSEGLNGELEYPQYTRPAEFRGWQVPEILSSGHHANIESWRREQSAKRTEQRRSARASDS